MSFNILQLQTKQMKNNLSKNKTKKKSLYLPNGQYDIFSIAQAVRETLEKNQKRIDEINDRLKKLEISIQKNLSNEIEIRDEIFHLNRELRKLKEHTTPDEFEREANSLLKEYEMYDNPSEDNFFDEGSCKKNNLKISSIIDKFIILSKRYITIPPKKYQIIDPFSCEQCGNNNWDNSLEGGTVCVECGLTMELFDSSASRSAQGIKKINGGNYSLDKHLNDAIMQMECKQKKEIPNEVYKNIYRELNKNDITIKSLTKIQLHNILQFLGYTDYQDVHKIHYEITKKAPIELSQWKNEIMQDHMLYQREYDKIKPEEKSNSQNKFYKLFRMCLRREEFVGYKDDWFMIEEKITLYENDTKKIYKNLGWDYTELHFNDLH